MVGILGKSVWRALNLSWLTGPIFDKELRVSSRRRRNYVLRFAYLVLLMIFIVIAWVSAVESFGSASVQTAKMSDAGMAVITTILMFQFIVMQLLAIVMLSTSISDEVYNRTLGVLMTTPINSFQIVMGKLFSKLLQLILLLAISLPLLAIVRVFGGVPWHFVISSLCITLTAVIFAGSLSLFFSVRGKRAYAVILKTAFTLGTLYLFLPVMVGFLVFRAVKQYAFFTGLIHVNPFVAIWGGIAEMIEPGSTAGEFWFFWPLHCAVMLLASAVLLAWSMKVVRTVALAQAVGQSEVSRRGRRRRRKEKAAASNAVRPETAGRIRRIKGAPIVWKELRTPMIQGGSSKGFFGFMAAVFAMLVTYLVFVKEDLLDEDFTHMTYVLIFVVLGLITNMVLSATSITTEKESRSWPILLATPLGDWQILMGKLVGVFRRCLPIWLLLAAHVIFFVLLGFIHVVTVFHLAIIVSWIVVFLSCTGIYFSARFKRTTAAVVANLALALTIWAVTPVVLGFMMEIFDHYETFERYMSVNPVVQALVVAEGACGEYNADSTLANLDYNWPSDDFDGFGYTTILLLLTMVSYMLIGLFFAWRAKCRLRRNIF